MSNQEITPVKAEIITPARIVVNIKSLESDVHAITSQVLNDTIVLNNSDDIKAAKKQRAYINKYADAIGKERRRVKDEFMQPFYVFERECKMLESELSDASRSLSTALMVEEKARMQQRFNDLKAYFEHTGWKLSNVIPFEKILDSEWMLKSTSLNKAKKCMRDKLNDIWDKYTSLKNVSDKPFYDVAERTFFDTCSLTDALNAMCYAKEQDARIKELRKREQELTTQTAPTFDWQLEIKGATEEQVKGVVGILEQQGIEVLQKKKEGDV